MNSSMKPEAEAEANEIRSRLEKGEKTVDVEKAYAQGTVKPKLVDQTFRGNSQR